MRPVILAGILLIALGVAGLAVDRIHFTDRDTVAEIGPITIQKEEDKSIPIPTLLGVVAVVAGIGFLAVGARRT